MSLKHERKLGNKQSISKNSHDNDNHKTTLKKTKTKNKQNKQTNKKKHVTTAATAAKLSLIKWACAISNLIAIIPFFNRSNANDFFGGKSNVRKKINGEKRI